MRTDLLEDECDEPAVAALLTRYCFGDSPEVEEQAVEAHLLACDRCWQDLQRLESSVRILRAGALGPMASRSELTSVFGLSGRLDRAFGGHLSYVLGVAILYGIEWTLGLWSELGYSYDRFGGLAWRLSGPVSIWVAATLFVALWFDTKATRAGKASGLFQSTAIVATGLGLLLVYLMATLPNERTILASFQTRTASSGYFKDALFIFLPLLPFVVPPFHTVLQLQRELRAGRHQQVFSFLARQPEGVSPRGLWYLSPTLLVAFLLLYGVLKITGANHMLDALTPGRYAGLFTMTAYISTALWFVIPLLSLVWYTTRLNELKRESLALLKLGQAPNR
jgi:hypothetical protein